MRGMLRRLAALVLAVALAATLSASAVAQEGVPTASPMRGVENRLRKTLANDANRDAQRTLRDELARIDRTSLSDEDWIDLHVVLMALDRALHKMPRHGLPNGVVAPARLSEDKFDKVVAGPAGREKHTWLLRRKHGFALTSEEVLRIGERARRAAAADLEAFAAAHGDGRTWQELMVEERSHCATTHEELVTRCADAAKAAEDAVVAAGLISVPEEARHLTVEAGPSTLPYAFACYLPGRFDNKRRFDGRYIVAPLPYGLGERDQAAWFGDVDDHFMRVVSAHEGVPGHHLQFTRAAMVESRIRGRGYNSVFVEGWGFYSEGLLDRSGVLTEPLDRLALLRMRAWRAVRCYVDPALHMGRIAPSQARDLLVAESGMSKRAAEREVTKYMEWPTQPLGYWIGRHEIERMRDAYVAQHGAGKLREFHDRLLGFGNIPLPLAAAVLLDEREAWDAAHP